MYCGYNTIHVIVVFSSVLDKHYHVGFLLTILSDIQWLLQHCAKLKLFLEFEWHTPTAANIFM